MLRNYIAAASRHLLRNRLHAGISIFGLAFGVTAALLTALILRSELTYDNFIPQPERAYLVGMQMQMPWRPPFWADTLNPSVAALLETNVPDIQSATRLLSTRASIKQGDTKAVERLYWADPDTFRVLPMPTAAGNAIDALHRPDGVVITREIARKYFKEDTPLGARLLVNGHPMTVAAVIETIPRHRSQFTTGIFVTSLASHSPLAADRDAPHSAGRSEGQINVRTYIRVSERSTPAALDAGLARALTKLWPDVQTGVQISLQALPIARVHRHASIDPGVEGRLTLILTAGLLIVFVACANFVNLATAGAATRALEVGVRKAAGAGRGTLIAQFLGESLAYVLIATLIALMLTELSLPHVNAFLETGATLDVLSHPALLGWIALGVLLLTVLAGGYPAFVLSSLKPASVLKGGLVHSRAANVIRQILVTTQFAVLGGLIVCALVVYEQREYLTHGELRVATDQHYIVADTDCDSAFARELTTLPGVRGVACTSWAFLSNGSFVSLKLRDGTPSTVGIEHVDGRAMPLYDITPLAGRLLDDSPASLDYAVINLSAVRQFGFGSPAAALGQELPLSPPGADDTKYRVVGVVRDFGLGMVGNQKLGPTVYVRQPANLRLLDVRLSGQQIPETLASIEALWTRTMGEVPWRTFFVDDFIEDLYRTMIRQSGVFGVLAGAAVVLSCLGLVGLSTAATARRTREIGIRKAMGADRRQIAGLLVWQFTRPVLLATLVACPVSAYFIQRWLNGFAYHVELTAWPFVLSATLALSIALLTVATHCISVARTTPVSALRYE